MRRAIVALALLCASCAHAPLYTLTPPKEVMPNAHQSATSGLHAVTGGAHPLNALLATPPPVTLRWTYPTQVRVPLPGGVPWRTICAPDTDRVDRIIAVWIRARRPSATWRDSSAVMLADSLAWRRLWPVVNAEAENVTLLYRVLADSAGWRVPGTRDSASVDGSFMWYGAACANAVQWSCEQWVAR